MLHKFHLPVGKIQTYFIIPLEYFKWEKNEDKLQLTLGITNAIKTPALLGPSVAFQASYSLTLLAPAPIALSWHFPG